MKIKILIPLYNDWQSLLKLLENINHHVSDINHIISIINNLNYGQSTTTTTLKILRWASAKKYHYVIIIGYVYYVMVQYEGQRNSSECSLLD